MANIQISEELMIAICKNVFFDVPYTKEQIDQLEDKMKRMAARKNYQQQLRENKTK